MHEPIECPSEALAPPGKAMKGHRWLYSEENGCVACRVSLPLPLLPSLPSLGAARALD